MNPISEELLDQTLDELDEFTPEQASEELAEIAKSQPDLLSFVVEFTEECSTDVQELAFYMFFVVYRTFQKTYDKTFEEIEIKELLTHYEQYEKLLENLENAHEKFIEKIAENQLSCQPILMSYIVETLFEEAENDEFQPLSDEEAGMLFTLMKVVIEVLDQKVRTCH